MGRGDKKTKRGKISMGTYGKIRPHEGNVKQTKATTDTAVSGADADTAAKRSRKKKDEDAAA